MKILLNHICGALGDLQSLLLLSGGLLLLRRPPETGMIFRGRVRNFELSSALLPFATAESLRLPENFLMEPFDELRIGDSVHESGDSHAFRRTLDVFALRLVSLYEVFCRFPISCLMFGLLRVSDAFFPIGVVFQECFPQVIVTVYRLWRKIVKPYPSVPSKYGVKHMTPCWHTHLSSLPTAWKKLM
ncbi:hypothetical protein Tco_0327727 [Tanacetum coccineum]